MTIRHILLTAVATVAITPIARSDEPPLAKKSALFDDSKLCIKVKATLNADKEFANLNLFVSVQDGVVAIQGPLPNEAAKERIQILTAGIVGVTAVKVDCFVVAGEDPLKKEIAARLSPVPKSTTPPPPAPVAIPTATGGLPSIAVGPPTLSLALAPTNDDLPSLNNTNSTVTVQRPIEPAGPMIAGGLLDSPTNAVAKPVAVKPLPNAPSAPRPYPTIPPPNVPILPVGLRPTSPEEIAFTLIELRKSDPRFAGFTATLTEGVVTISGTGSIEARDAFIAATRQLSGVSRVEVK